MIRQADCITRVKAVADMLLESEDEALQNVGDDIDLVLMLLHDGYLARGKQGRKLWRLELEESGICTLD